MNKTDIVTGGWPKQFLPLSVHLNQGLDGVTHALAAHLGDINLAEDDVVVTRERHRQALDKALNQIETGMLKLGREDQLDLVAMEWRAAWALFGSILGVGDVEDILDHVFSEFCIGK